MSLPHTFAERAGPVSAGELDENFAALADGSSVDVAALRARLGLTTPAASVHGGVRGQGDTLTMQGSLNGGVR